MKKFAYLFPLFVNGTEAYSSKIVWSGETEETLLRRLKSDFEKNPDLKGEIEEFIAHSKPGYHIELPTGEFIFCTE